MASPVEAGGYAMRTLSHDDVRKIMPFVVQNLLIMAAPPLLAASIFLSPRRIAQVLESMHFLAWPRLLPKLFIVVDLICLVTQTAGAIISGSEDQNEARQGELTIKIGLIVQLIAIISFVLWLGRFHHRHRTSKFDSGLTERLSWRRVMWGLYIIALLFVIRTVTRLVEYAQGPDGPMLSNEVYLYVLDALVMWTIAVLLLVLHPGRLRRQARRIGSKQRLQRTLTEEELVHLSEPNPGRLC
jgi:hypothetical protein